MSLKLFLFEIIVLRIIRIMLWLLCFSRRQEFYIDVIGGINCSEKIIDEWVFELN